VLRVVEIYVGAYLRMTEGQHLDLLHQGRLDLGIEPYLDVIARKSASAVESFAEAAALLGTAGADVRTAYRSFGRSFGILYQICDDIRAIWSTQADTGKKPLHDIVTRKTTLPLLLGMQRGSAKLHGLLVGGAGENCNFTGSDAAFIAAELTALGVRDACLAHVVQYRDAALAELDRTGDASPEQQMLVAMVKLCAEAAGATGATGATGDRPGVPNKIH
jgi:geranylgeranyl pyrophosphate synthase